MSKVKTKSKNDFDQLKNKLADLEEKWKRALADYCNLEKRVNKQQQNTIKFANAALIDKLLGVLDGLEKSTVCLKDRGLDIVVDQFKSVLTSEGVKKIKVQGKQFDPQTMDCVELVSGDKEKVIEVVEPGYFLGEKVIRPAKVKVGKGGKHV